jgi:biopolymer transport protein ExbD
MKSSPHREPEPHVPLQMVAFLPLLVIFLVILVHYIEDWSAIPIERELPLARPPLSEQIRTLNEAPVHIRIDRTARVSIEGVLSCPADDSALAKLRKYLRSRSTDVNRAGGVLIVPAADVNFQRLIDVISAVRSAGIQFYDFADDPPP